MDRAAHNKILEQNGCQVGLHSTSPGRTCPYCQNKNSLIKELKAVAEHAAALFQKGGQFEYCVGSNYQKDLQEALKKVGLL